MDLDHEVVNKDLSLSGPLALNLFGAVAIGHVLSEQDHPHYPYTCVEPSLRGDGLAVFSGAAAQLARSRTCVQLI